MEIEDEDDIFIFVWEGDRIVGYRKDQCIDPDLEGRSNPECKCKCEGREMDDDYKNSEHYCVSRTAWKKFLVGCLAVVEDARQMQASARLNGGPGLNVPHANLLDTNGNMPPWRLDVHTSASPLMRIPVAELTSGLKPDDVTKLWIEKDPRTGFPTRNPWELVQNCPANGHAGLGLVQYTPMNQPPPANAAGLPPTRWRQLNASTSFSHFRRWNNTPIGQPGIPESRSMFDLVRKWMNTWSDPECPGLNADPQVDPSGAGKPTSPLSANCICQVFGNFDLFGSFCRKKNFVQRIAI